MVGRRPFVSSRSGPPPAASHLWTGSTATVTERVTARFWSGLVDLMAQPGGIGTGRRGLGRSSGVMFSRRLGICSIRVAPGRPNPSGLVGALRSLLEGRLADGGRLREAGPLL